MKLTAVSNNPLMQARWADRLDFRFIDGSCRDVLLAARDLCHCGRKLLSHPLSGSVKPNETPYKSILLSGRAGITDSASVELMEKAIITADKFGPVRRNWQTRELEDFQLVDADLIESALESALTDPLNL